MRLVAELTEKSVTDLIEHEIEVRYVFGVVKIPHLYQ